ncbi:Na+/H+ antiporter NhaC family protein [Marinilabiliaceae bacterium JC017]|nr:Na+/H+ antiporter NhaC family protein [Marinilabiliaceae bacterium JC017]
MKCYQLIITAILIFTLHEVRAITQSPQIELTPAIVRNVETTIQINAGYTLTEINQPLVLVNGIPIDLSFKNGSARFNYTFTAISEIKVITHREIITQKIDPIPLWLSILPPLIAILMALLTKEVFSSLFIGILIGTVTIFRYNGFDYLTSLFKGAFAIVDTYLLAALNNTDHLSIIIFSMLIGGMVALITINGGMKGIVNILSRYAHSRRSGQFITWLMGLLIFFDDYANTLVVGNTMRPVTDRLRISREKLAYLVDSTSAPIAALAFITTWIGAELSYIQEGLKVTGIDSTPYTVFFNSLPYSFYPFLTLIFVVVLIWMKRDFGPMLKAEKSFIADPDKALETHQQRRPQIFHELDVPGKTKGRWYNAALPVTTVILGTLAGLFYTGWSAATWSNASLSFFTKLSITIGAADTFKALLWSSLAGVLMALVLTTAQRVLNLKESIETLTNGFKTMFNAVLILTLAWALALLTQHLHTAEFITGSIRDIAISPKLLPAITFVASAVIAFSTGSSWGTMAIIYPIILPATWKICVDTGLNPDHSMFIFHNVVSTVLAGSVWGDHCSPISDTTILSSLASSCHHINHVRTQMPYALIVGAISVLCGTLPVGYGFPIWMAYPIAITLIVLVIRIRGKKVSEV